MSHWSDDDGDWPYGYDEDGEPINPFNTFGTHAARRKPPALPSDNSDRRYICSKCKAELQLDVVKRVERIEPESYGFGGGPAEIRIVHACKCQSYVRKARYPFDDAALRRLFSGTYTLPWPMTYQEEKGEVASDPPPSLESADDRRERLYSRWAFDLGAVETGGDFLLLCRGPKSEDASIVEAFWKRWGGAA